MGFRVETSHRGDLQPGDGRQGGEWLAGPSAANPADGQFDDLVLAVEHGIIGSRAPAHGFPERDIRQEHRQASRGGCVADPHLARGDDAHPVRRGFASLVAPHVNCRFKLAEQKRWLQRQVASARANAARPVADSSGLCL